MGWTARGGRIGRESSGETVMSTVGIPFASISRCTATITRWQTGQPPVSTTASACERSISAAMAGASRSYCAFRSGE